MLFHSGIAGLEIQTEILDVVESTLHQNALDIRHSLGGEGGIPLRELYMCVRPQRAWFFSRFGLKSPCP